MPAIAENSSSRHIIHGNNLASIFGENESNLQDLMNSFGGGSSSIFGFGGGFNANRGSLERIEEAKLQQNVAGSSMGGSDRLTRDFLGVGEIVRSMSGGFSQREQQNHHSQQQSLEMGSLDSETAPSSQSFGNFQ